ncbi:MAG: FixH family protein [Rhizobiaceae bacterium]|nr:FixH family protein [Rhizobiaceae bacterium]
MSDHNNGGLPLVGENPRKLTGYHVLAMVLAFFAVIITANFSLAWFATKSWTGLVVKNSYVESQQYNDKIAAAARQKARGWQMKFAYSNNILEISMSDRDKQPVIIDKLQATIGRPVSENQDVDVILLHKGSGRYETNVELSAGLWGFKLNSDGEEQYYIEGRFVVDENGIGKM